MINIISKTKYAYVFSGVLTVMCIASLFVWGLKLGIDFTGGTLMEVQFENNLPSNSEIEENLKNLNLKSLSLQATGNNTILLRYVPKMTKLTKKF